MKCSKCGEECDEKQAFCMKCGNPIQIIPDLNLIEEELANNVGELMNEIDESEEEVSEPTKIISDFEDEDYLRDTTIDMSDDINIPDIKDDSLELVEMAREHDARQKKQQNVKKVQRDDYQVNAMKNDNVHKNKNKNNAKKKREKKIKIGIICGTIAVIIAIAVTVVIVMSNKGDSKEKFADIYNEGVAFYSAKEYDSAINSFQKAISLADTDDENISANKSLYDTYMKKGFKNLSESEIDECIDLLKTLIDLDSENAEYYEDLISLYEKAKMDTELTEFKESLVGTTIGDKLGISSISAPKFSVEDGEYDKYFTVEIDYDEGSKVYYTVDGSQPDETSTEYTQAIDIKEQGTIVIKAVAIDEDGNASDIATANYTVKLESIDAPEVTPSSGTYDEATQIKVEVPDGMKAYYTIDEYGSTPDTSSTEYTGPIDMPRGKNVFSVILVDESGMSSDVTENIYKYNVDRNYSYDEALALLKEKLIDDDTILDDSGAMIDGALMEFSYKEISIIDNNEYYLTEATYKSRAGKVIDTYIYGIDTVTGNIVSVSAVDGTYKVN